jgi:hypothetical protein
VLGGWIRTNDDVSLGKMENVQAQLTYHQRPPSISHSSVDKLAAIWTLSRVDPQLMKCGVVSGVDACIGERGRGTM